MSRRACRGCAHLGGEVNARKAADDGGLAQVLPVNVVAHRPDEVDGGVSEEAGDQLGVPVHGLVRVRRQRCHCKQTRPGLLQVLNVTGPACTLILLTYGMESMTEKVCDRVRIGRLRH